MKNELKVYWAETWEDAKTCYDLALSVLISVIVLPFALGYIFYRDYVRLFCKKKGSKLEL